MSFNYSLTIWLGFSDHHTPIGDFSVRPIKDQIYDDLVENDFIHIFTDNSNKYNIKDYIWEPIFQFDENIGQGITILKLKEKDFEDNIINLESFKPLIDFLKNIICEKYSEKIRSHLGVYQVMDMS